MAKRAISQDDVTDSAIDLLDRLEACFDAEISGAGTAKNRAGFTNASRDLRDLLTAEVVSRINYGRGSSEKR